MALPSYFFIKDYVDTTLAALLLVVIAAPFFFLAIFEKDGQPLEKVAKNMYLTLFKRPGVRPYKTNNFYAEISGGNGKPLGKPTKAKRKRRFDTDSIQTK